MSSVSKAENGICLSVQAFARELKCCRKHLGEKIKATGLKPAGTGQTGHPTYRMADVFEVLLNEALQKVAVSDDPSQWSPRDRLDHYRAENERIKLETAQRRLIPIEQYEDTLSTAFKSLALGLETMPDVIERDAGLTGCEVDIMQRIIDSQRQMLYDSLVAQFNG